MIIDKCRPNLSNILLFCCSEEKVFLFTEVDTYVYAVNNNLGKVYLRTYKI